MDKEIELEIGDTVCVKFGNRYVTFEACEDSLLIEDGIVHIT